MVLQRTVIDKGDRGMISSSYKESDKVIRADVVNKEAEISPEVRNKEGREKDYVTENKTVTDVAGEFRCKDCKEGRNPPCFACG